MYRRIRQFTAQHIEVVGTAILGSVIALFVVGQFVPPVGNWIISGSLFSVVTVALLVDILGRLADPEVRLESHKAWESTREDLIKYIRENRPERADLLEYSAWQLNWLLSELRKVNAQVRILLANPAHAVNAHESRRIEDNLHTLKRDFPDFAVRLYDVPPSLRGRQIDDYIALGWYTHTGSGAEVNVHGHDNAVVVTRAYCREGRPLEQTFERSFTALWDDGHAITPTDRPKLAV